MSVKWNKDSMMAEKRSFLLIDSIKFGAENSISVSPDHRFIQEGR
jgi:hypothetical protein